MLSVRELQKQDIPLLTSYWLDAEDSFLLSMGVDLAKLPGEDGLKHLLQTQLDIPIERRNSYCIIWEYQGRPAGHSNTNPTNFGVDAFMHLHVWDPELRSKGHGLDFVKMTLPYFFENLELQTLYCQPYALNPAPHRTLKKAGFEFVKEYTTVPGTINFEQPVKQWRMTREKYNRTL